MTVNAEANAQSMPITTHASKPRRPKTVEAKNSGSGTKSRRMMSCHNFVSMRADTTCCQRTRMIEDHAANLKALFSMTGSSSLSELGS